MTMTTPERAAMAKRDKEMIPTVLIRSMLFLAILSLGLVALARLTDRPLVGVASQEPVVAERSVYLAPGESRGTFVLTESDGSLIVKSSDARAGFVGVIGQVVARRRMLDGTEGNPALTILRRENGRTDIVDTGTGLTIELMGYGQDNVAVFANLLDGS